LNFSGSLSGIGIARLSSVSLIWFRSPLLATAVELWTSNRSGFGFNSEVAICFLRGLRINHEHFARWRRQ